MSISHKFLKETEMNKLCTLCFALLLTACGSGLNGTYSDQLGMTTYSFKPDGKVVLEVLGTATELSYELDGEKLKIVSPQGNFIMTVKDKDSIVGPMGMVLARKK
jgi:hypothetical protein